MAFPVSRRTAAILLPACLAPALFLWVVFSAPAAGGPETNPAPAAAPAAEQAGAGAQPEPTAFPTELRHARGFEVARRNGVTYVTVHSPWPGAAAGIRYALIRRGDPPPSDVPPARVIEIPVRSVVTLSATYLAELEILGLSDRIVGHAGLPRVYSPVIRAAAEQGAVREVGDGGAGVNTERLLDLKPDLVLAYGLGNAYDVHPKLEELGLKVVINADWLEATPLGRSEWIKFLALFFGKEQEAELAFTRIESRYLELTDLVRGALACGALACGAVDRPTVFLDAPFQDTWWTAGGASHMAGLLRDAGADYLWAENDEFSSLPLNFEAVYERAAEAKFWLNPGGFESLKGIVAADERFAAFRAFRKQQVYNCIARRTSRGGNDYWESGPANPQLVLADLIAILHPGLLPEHRLFYYRRLEPARPGAAE
jgi:iron complex transport system substrate-binding protein